VDVGARVTSKGQITIPKSVREALRLRDGDRVVFRVIEGERAILARTPNLLELARSVPVPGRGARPLVGGDPPARLGDPAALLSALVDSNILVRHGREWPAASTYLTLSWCRAERRSVGRGETSGRYLAGGACPAERGRAVVDRPVRALRGDPEPRAAACAGTGVRPRAELSARERRRDRPRPRPDRAGAAPDTR
jgi:antitoxin PrlF